MEQNQFTSIFCARPQNFAWFLGAGASRTSGLPTASDITWDLKRRYYCREENQEISRQDIQNQAVKARIQAFMDSRGFPPLWAEDEYPVYFEKIFGADKELQRRYLKAILAEDKVKLSVGNRVLGALVASELCRVVFTTNFDSVLEKAVAEVSGRSLAAYHIEGAHVANQALNNEEFPIYCKLHGDFRYDSLKNLPDDLAAQNAKLAECMVNAGNRFGVLVVGYSGRDKSIMDLFHRALDGNNPFPHGLIWTGIKGGGIPPAVKELLSQAEAKGVDAHYVEIETFDALLLRLWRNIDKKSPEIDGKVRRSQSSAVDIPLPQRGSQSPLVRLNALPVLSAPQYCLELELKVPKEWSELNELRNNSQGKLIFTKSNTVWCWGLRERIKRAFGKELKSFQVRDISRDLFDTENLHVKGFVEEGICRALANGKPLLVRRRGDTSYLIVDRHADDQSAVDPLFDVIGKESGEIKDLYTPVTEEHPHVEQVSWAEAVQVSSEVKNGVLWLLLDPDIWVWPPRARKDAIEFMDARRSDRFNRKYNELLDAWVQVVLGSLERGSEVTVSAFGEGGNEENPSFVIGSRTAFSRKVG